MVPQETLLFSATIRENIIFGCPGASNRSIKDVTEMACLNKDIADFPNGYETLVGERGVTLSGGQKQRIAIARALLPTPRLLLADEPTGNLDAVNTSRTLTLLQEEARHAKATLLMVTHDHALLEHFDRVIDFSNWIPEATTC